MAFNVDLYTKSGHVIKLKGYTKFNVSHNGDGSISKIEWDRGEFGTPRILKLDLDDIAHVLYEET